MSDVTLEQVLQLAEQLSPADRAALIQRLQALSASLAPITLEAIQAEHARRLAAGAFDHAESLFGKYARPGLDLTLEDIEAAIHEYSWEDDIDELSNGG